MYLHTKLKKAAVGCLMLALGYTSVNAQDATTASSAKTFGGRSQYRTWAVGLNAGIVSPFLWLGGSNDFTDWKGNLGYGATVRKQLSHSFGLELGFLRSDIEGTNGANSGGLPATGASGRRSFNTQLSYSGSIMGVVNVANVDFLRRKSSLTLLAKAGYGLAGYDYSYVDGNGTTVEGGPYGTELPRDHDNVHEQFFPVGAGLKFKLSSSINFNLGYNMYFLDGDNLDGTYAKNTTKDKWSYGYGGVEFILGSSAKPALEWNNPISVMYDELKDPSLRQEVEALKGKVGTLEGTVKTLSTDSDGDGVADKFDKCPGTAAGVKVDGAGCEIKHPEAAPGM